MLSLSQCQTIINRQLNEIKLPGLPSNLYEPVKYMLNQEAKRLRPALVLMACNVYTDNVDQAINAAMATEVFHNFTLIHDDIMDQSELRRNSQTVHVKWNPNVAILSGDAMLIKAYELLSYTSPDKLALILPVFNDMALKVCEGQQFDMDYENEYQGIDIKDYLKMVEFKTAVLIAAALKIGALSGGAPARDAENLYQFGRNIGIAFQLQDDLLDVYGDSTVFGKVTGNDIVSNKKTILLIEALNSTDVNARKELTRWLRMTEFDREEKIRSVKDIYSALNIKTTVELKIRSYHDNANRFLDQLQVPDDKKPVLRSFSEYLLSRNK